MGIGDIPAGAGYIRQVVVKGLKKAIVV